MVILFSNSLCYDTMTELNFLGRNSDASYACIHLDALSTPHLAMYWSPVWTPRVHEQTQKMDRKGGSRSAARKNQCGTRSTRLVKSSETVDKSKPRDVWTYETYVISLGTVRFSVLVIFTVEAKYTQERCGWGWWGAYWGSEHRWVDQVVDTAWDVRLARAPRIGYAVQEALSRRLEGVFSRFLGSPENCK